jgi:hypothetical protein
VSDLSPKVDTQLKAGKLGFFDRIGLILVIYGQKCRNRIFKLDRMTAFLLLYGQIMNFRTKKRLHAFALQSVARAFL